MLELGWFSAKLLFQGKLIREPRHFLQQAAIGTIIGVLLLISIVLVKFPLWLSVVISSFVTGLIMPFLVKDFK
jgi:hypothetical protein